MGTWDDLGARHVLVIISFIGLANVYLLRVNLNVAIVAMVKTAEPILPNNATGCPMTSNSLLTKIDTRDNQEEKGNFEWTPYDQGLILGAFFYGYVISNIIGGTLAERFGGKIVFGLGILITALLTLLTPLAARTSRNAIITLRVLEGISEGVVFPALHTICGRWLPKQERAFLYSLIHMGAEFGTVIGFPIAGALSGSTFLGGWPAVFYVFGTLGIVWFFFWWKLMFDSPSQHPRISVDERKYILKSLEHKPYHENNDYTPWSSIFTSVPVWAMAFSGFFGAWSFYTVFTDLSSFLSNVLHFDVRTNGIVSSLPHILNVIVQGIAGYTADVILSKKWLGVTATRKSYYFLAHALTASCFFGAILSGCNSTWVMIFITVATGASGLSTPAGSVALLDMAPNYAGTLMGLTNGFSNMAGFLAPYVVGVLTDHNDSLEQWHKIFYIAVGASMISGCLFTLLATSELQPWAFKDGSADKTLDINRTPMPPEQVALFT